MAHKRIERTYLAICSECSGRGFVPTKRGYVKCTAPGCVRGDVVKVLVELVTVEDKDDAKTS